MYSRFTQNLAPVCKFIDQFIHDDRFKIKSHDKEFVKHLTVSCELKHVKHFIFYQIWNIGVTLKNIRDAFSTQ